MHAVHQLRYTDGSAVRYLRRRGASSVGVERGGRVKPIRLYVFGRKGKRYAGFVTNSMVSGVGAWAVAANALYSRLGQGWHVVYAEVIS